MKNIINALVSVFILLSLNSCSKELKTYELTIYTFGNEIKPNDKFPEDIKQLLEPLENSCLSKVFFEDKIYGWKNNIDIENLSKQKNGLSHENKNGNSTLLNQYFAMPENNILYTNKSDKNDKKAFNYDIYYTTLIQDTSKTILIYSADEYITNQKNVFNKIKSLRDQIENINIKEPWKEIIIFYKPEIKTLTDSKKDIEIEKGMSKNKEDNPIGNNKEPLKETEPPKEPEVTYPTILSKTVALEAKKSTISWRNIKLKTEKNTVANYKIDYFLYGENQPMFTTITTDTKTNYESCDKCNKLPEGSVITINVSLQTTPNSYTTIAACDLAPTNKSLTNCHCPLYIINK